MSFQEAVAVPILYDLALGSCNLERGYSDTENFHARIARWFPTAASRLDGDTISDGSQTKLYNSIRQGIRKLAKWDPSPIDWERRKRIAINKAGWSYLQRRLVSAQRFAPMSSSPSEVADSVEKMKLGEFIIWFKENHQTLRPGLMAYARSMHNVR